MSTCPSHPMQKDDFKRIHGIGPGIESRLYGAHIHTFAQLAALTPHDLALELQGLAGLSTERIVQQDWIGQARKLAEEKTEERAVQAEEWTELSPAPIHSEDYAEGIVEEGLASDRLTPQSRKHYVNFTVELWLEENNDVRRTRVIHVQDHSEIAWSGWEGQKLIDFIVERARLFQPAQPAIAEQPQTEPAYGQPPLETGREFSPPVQAAALAGELMLKEMKVATMENPHPTHILDSSQPFHIHLELDLSKINAPPGASLGYSAKVFAEDLSKGTHLMVVDDQGEIMLTEEADIEIEGNRLPAGIYRLETVVNLSQLSGAAPRTKLMAFLDGGVFHVY